MPVLVRMALQGLGQRLVHYHNASRREQQQSSKTPKQQQFLGPDQLFMGAMTWQAVSWLSSSPRRYLAYGVTQRERDYNV